MEKLTTEPMTPANAKNIACWKYERPYDLYNLDGSAEAVSELLQEEYWTVHANGQFVGFYCTGPAAQVPAGYAVKAYADDDDNPCLDIGVGMRPDLTGHGFGSAFFGYILQDACDRYHCSRLRLTVASFNQRAIHLYEKFGFQSRMEFTNNGVLFQTMVAAVGVKAEN